MRFTLAAFFMLLAFAHPHIAFAQAPSSVEADKAQLRQVLTSLQEAINEGRYDDVTKFFYKDFTATMITQEVAQTPDEIAAYFKKWITGKDAVIRKLTVAPIVEGETRIYDGRFAVAHGRDRETYELSTGQTYEMVTRWTASLIKENGQWKITSFHAGVNFLDNPVLAAAGKSSIYLAAAGGIAGLFAGWLGMYLWCRRRRKKLAA